ncbi:hypothetical protein WA158_008527 [Blastocystis sp. Blastoise]
MIPVYEDNSTVEQEDDNSPYEGRIVAESMLNISKSLITKEEVPQQPYYWEPDYPINDPRDLTLTTIISHNIYYSLSTIVNWCVEAGKQVIDFLGWNQSNYEWIVQDMKREEEEKEAEERYKITQYENTLRRREYAIKNQQIQAEEGQQKALN